MRLALIGNPNSIHVRRWVEDLAARGHNVELIGEHPLFTPPPAGCTLHDLTRLVNVRKLRYLAWAQAVRRLLRRSEPQIVHAIGVASAGWLGAAARMQPLVITATGSDLLLLPDRSRAHRALSAWSLRRASQVIAVSEPLVEIARRLTGRPDRVQLIPNGTDIRLFSPPGGPVVELRSRFGLPTGPLALSLRAMQPLYRPLDIAAAIPGVLTALPQARFAILVYNADPDLLARFEADVQAADAAHAVTYIKSLSTPEEIAALNQAADVAISVPQSDGSPVSVLEALACATPVIAGDVPGITDWVQPGRTGWVIPVGERAALRQALIEALSSPEECRRRGQAGRQHVVEHGDRQEVLDRTEALYTHLRAKIGPCEEDW